MLTLGQIATLTLVRSVGTIGCIVAHGGDVDATFRHPRTLPLAMRALEGGRDTGMLRALVRVVSTVVLAIAYVCLEDTVRVVALEEVLGAGDLSTVLLVGVIGTVVGAITVPGNGYTETGGLAAEMLLDVTLIGTHRGATQFIAAIITIRYAIAFVGLLDALPQIGALELIGQATDRWAILLVLLVKAIIIPIADPTLRYAVTRSRAGELEIGAGLLRTEVSLIAAVATIVLAVASPHAGNAASIGAGKLGRGTGHIAAVQLIRVVATVVLLVAAEVQWNATSRFALEFVGAAGGFCAGERGKRI